jgi:hypothetical protein
MCKVVHVLYTARHQDMSEVKVELGASRPGRSIPFKTASNIHWIGDWMRLEPVWTMSCTDKCFLLEEIEPKFLGRLSRRLLTVPTQLSVE